MSAPLSSPASQHGFRVIFTTLGLLWLGACTSMKDIPPGTPLAEIEARYGAPTIECPLPDGSRRLVWSTQPMGQFAWATQVGSDSRAAAVEQVLTDASFRRVQLKSWTDQQLRCAFGPPADITTVGMPSVRQTVWSYRYLESGVWNSLMYFYVGDDGVVYRMHPGPDPLYDPQEWPFMR